MSTVTQQYFQALKRQLQKTPAEVAKEMDYPSAWESGVTHPLGSCHFLCRDDGVAEMSAGPSSSITVDPAQRQITLEAEKIALTGNDVHLHSGPMGLWFGFQRFDPMMWWAQNPVVNDPTRHLWNGPLVLNDPSALAFLNGSPPFDLVAGTPDFTIGQYNVALSTIMHPQPLLGPSEWLRIITHKMKSLGETLALHT